MLTVNHLSKSFDDIQAVKDLSFHVKKGDSFAFLGTNGAGKSTVIHMMIDLLKPDEGTITFANEASIGVVFQSHRLDEAFTIEENVMMRAKLYGMSRADAKKRLDDLLQITNLADKRKRIYGKCSGGEKRKADIIRALVHEPSFLILDEPTTGLDANAREEIWMMLRQLQIEQGLTIFLTTHYIEEAENVDYVLIMNEGEVEVEGKPQQLREQYARTMLKMTPYHQDELIDMLQHNQYTFELEGNDVVIPLKTSKDAIPILNGMEDCIQNFSLTEASLEQVYLQVTEQIKEEKSDAYIN